MPITDHLYEDSIDGLCKAVVPGRQGDRDFCDQPPEEHERPAVDLKGTCHLVGCVGKGVHGPEGPHSRKADPPSAALPSMLRPKIGVPDSWAPYEGGPTIPKPESEHCRGFAKLDVTTVGALAYCSIVASAWSHRISTGSTIHMGNLVDEHKRDCPNRRVR